MPDQTTEAESALRKLGQRLRQAYAKQHPIPEKSLDTVRSAVREQWERDRAVQRDRGPTPPSPAKGQQRKPKEPDRDR